jgi:hypothetical protein
LTGLVSGIPEEVAADSDYLSPDRLPNQPQAQYLFAIGVTATKAQNSSYVSPSRATRHSLND